ncbi:hypothetical protein CK568_02620 [Campylobacter lari]|uniref:hypothetical protein n=1 Tax=Campylobacter lari TaxID=201 RepID=UPI0012855520|nr:hypothetical protein [Campylobacter lari]EAJ5675472.1 hypothetical protein [Campylobacter lari]EAK0767204.1 hypothetical protein [Campylobacter lari]EAK5586215.1 hypothetical protein [Campylobacter lari]EAK5785703.1 hypothetical protein [Campylobacter lari]
MFKSYKKFVLKVLFIPLPFIFCYLVYMFIYDPLMLYHKPWFRAESFDKDSRLANQGIIKNYSFDSIIIGSSMLENSSPKKASLLLNERFINISSPGLYFNERAIFLNYAFLKNKNIKRVIYSLDLTMILDLATRDTKYFDFLYDDNYYNDILVYLQKRFLFCVLNINDDCNKNKDLDLRTFWINDVKHRFGGFENWLKSAKYYRGTSFAFEKIRPSKFVIKNNYSEMQVKMKQMQNILKVYLLEIIEKNPQIDFDILIPSYSRLFYSIDNGDRGLYFSRIKSILHWIVLETSKYQNVKIYGFDDLDYADNIANYRDLTHYNIDMNEMQLIAIKNQTNILTKTNIEEYLENFENKIRKYNIDEFIKAVKKYFPDANNEN